MVIVVNQGESIQHAVDRATPRDTVLVKAGVFRESVQIGDGKERLRIVGEGADKTILDGSEIGPVHGFFICGSPLVTVAGFTIRNFEHDGICVHTDDNVIRSNTVTQNAGRGIAIAGGARNLVKDNELSHNGRDGLTIDGGMRNYIIGNRIERNGDSGVDLEPGSTLTLVLDNMVHQNGSRGICVHSDRCWIVGNRVLVNQSEGIDLETATHTLLYGNVSTENAQHGLEIGAIAVVAAQNKFNGNKVDGVNVAADAKVGTAWDGLAVSLFFRNEISANTQSGFRALDKKVVGTLFLRNDIDENGADGLDLSEGLSNRLILNGIDGNGGVGVALNGKANKNVLDDNVIAENGRYGIRLDVRTTINTLRSNKLGGSKPSGIVAAPPADENNTLDRNEGA